MEKTTLYLPSRLQADLRAIARRTGRPQAALIRDALEAYVAGQEQPWPTSIGIEADGSMDGADVEGWLADEWEADLRRHEDEAAANMTTPAPAPPAPPPRGRTGGRRAIR